jgi:hypothetical protein
MGRCVIEPDVDRILFDDDAADDRFDGTAFLVFG